MVVIRDIALAKFFVSTSVSGDAGVMGLFLVPMAISTLANWSSISLAVGFEESESAGVEPTRAVGVGACAVTSRAEGSSSFVLARSSFIKINIWLWILYYSVKISRHIFR